MEYEEHDEEITMEYVITVRSPAMTTKIEEAVTIEITTNIN